MFKKPIYQDDSLSFKKGRSYVTMRRCTIQAIKFIMRRKNDDDICGNNDDKSLVSLSPVNTLGIKTTPVIELL